MPFQIWGLANTMQDPHYMLFVGSGLSRFSLVAAVVSS